MLSSCFPRDEILSLSLSLFLSPDWETIMPPLVPEIYYLLLSPTYLALGSVRDPRRTYIFLVSSPPPRPGIPSFSSEFYAPMQSAMTFEYLYVGVGTLA